VLSDGTHMYILSHAIAYSSDRWLYSPDTAYMYILSPLRD